MKNGNHTTVHVRLSQDTKDLLTDMKYNKNESYDSVIQRMLYIEEKYNSIDIQHEYELHIDDTFKVFKIHFKDGLYNIYYYDGINHEWNNSAKVWCVSDDESDNLFVDRLLSLMSRDDAVPLLLDMTGELSFEGYSVKKI